MTPCPGAHGVPWAQTLTGFKWICAAALDMEAAGENPMVLGYEEALGYSVGTNSCKLAYLAEFAKFLGVLLAGECSTIVRE